jgi:hypothetical protein
MLLVEPPLDLRGDPAVAGGQPVQTQLPTNVKFRQAPEVEALQRWRRGQFQDVT